MKFWQRIRASKQGGHFLSGISVLTVSALLVKVIGLAYRIPMLHVLGSEGMGYFNTAYEVYALLCVLSTAGLPVAMSLLISEVEAGTHGAEDDVERAGTVRRIFHVSFLLFLGLGLVGSGLMWSLASPLGRWLGNPEAAACIRAISPTVFLICLSGAFRGYFQGRRNMVPTAVSQVIEALGKLLLGMAFALYAQRKGADLPTVAAWAVLGLTVGTALSVGYLVLHKRLTTAASTLPPLPRLSRNSGEDHRQILRRLLKTAVPVTVSAGVISLTKCVDVALILHRMQEAGLDARLANTLYGCYSTLAVPIFNMLPALTTPVAMSAVPTLSAALSRLRSTQDAQQAAEARHDIRKTATTALRLTTCLAVPAGLGLCVFAGDILQLLFSGQPEAVAMATPWLRVLGLSVPSACLITVTGAMLQASGHATCPVISMLAGTGVKVGLAYVLLGMPSLGLLGAPLSSLACDTVILVMQCLFLVRHAPDLLPSTRTWMWLMLGPLGAAALSFLPVLFIGKAVWGDVMSPVRTVVQIAGVMAGVGLLYGLCLGGQRWRSRRVAAQSTT